MTIQKWAWTFGIVFVLIGILGFIPGITMNGHLFGIFHVDTAHNVVHLLSGIIAFWVAVTSTNAARMYFRIFGIIYGVIMILGFIQNSDTVLGLIANNMADNFLHLVIAALSLWIGFGMKDQANA